MKNLFRKYTALSFALLMVVFIPTSCIEDLESEIDGKGNNFFRFAADAGFHLASFDAKAGKYALIDVVRDVNSNAAINQAQTIGVAIDNSIVEEYNAGLDEDETPYTILDASKYTLSTSSLQFGSGEFAKSVEVDLNPVGLDYSQKYAIGVAMTNVPSGYQLSAANGKVLVEVIVKNAYHGVYQSTGYFTHPVAESSRAISREKELLTVGATTVNTELGDLGGSGYNMNLTVNGDNTVTIAGFIGAASTPINQTWGPNYYDPATKTFHLHYSYNVAAPRIIEETITLK